MSTDAAPRMGRDEVFSLLSNRRRRYALHHCRQVEEPVTVSDLAERVAAWEYDKAVEEITSAERKRVYTSLQQTHLPTMDDAGVVKYEDHEVELTDAAEEVAMYLELVPEESISWSQYYLGLSALGGAILLAVQVGVYPAGILPDLAWGGLVVGLFAVSAVAHHVRTREMKIGQEGPPPEIRGDSE